MILMKEENVELKKFKEEIMLKKLERESHVIAQQQIYTQMKKELECELRKYRQMQLDLKREKVEGDKGIYTLEAELFLSKMAEEDLAHENEELKQEKLNADKERVEVARRAKKLKRSTRRHVLQAFHWKQKTADPVLLEAACAFWDAFGIPVILFILNIHQSQESYQNIYQSQEGYQKCLKRLSPFLESCVSFSLQHV